MERTGISFFFKFAWTFLIATLHTGTIAATNGIAVCGLKYPSGICIIIPPLFKIYKNKKP
jgi:hypothetical protein